jgi:Zn-finger nucleic acid-binding protein
MKSCPGCSAATDPAAAFCSRCGARLDATRFDWKSFGDLEKTGEAPSSLDCPRCPTRLTEIRYGKLWLDECSSCRGIWFDRGELARAAQLFKARAPAPPPRSAPPALPQRRIESLTCPRCRAKMKSFACAGVMLDRCARCGVWVDGGEFERIYASYQLPSRRTSSVRKFYARRDKGWGDAVVTGLGILSVILGPSRSRCRHRHSCCCGW